MAVEFHEAENPLVALLGLFECQEADTRIVDLYKRKFLAQNARLTRGPEPVQALVVALSLPAGLPVAPIAAVPRNAITEFVMADILRGLIWVASRRPRSSD